LTILLLVGFFAPVIELHLPFIDDLAEVNETLDACALWEVAHINLEPVLVIKGWVRSNQESFCEFTERWHDTASNLGGFVRKRPKEIVDVGEIGSHIESFPVFGKILEDL